MNRVIKGMVIGILCAFVAPGVKAEDLTGRCGIGVDAGAAIPVGGAFVRDNGDVGPAAGVFLRHGFSSHWGAALGYENLSFDNNLKVDNVLLSGIYSFMPEKRWTPTALVGAGLGAGIGNRDFNDFAAKAGLGVDYFLNSDWSVGLQAVYHFVSETGDATRVAHAIVPGANLTYYFGKDGAPAPAPKPAPVVEKKAPVDSDGDGVIDDRDRCPNTPRGAKVDGNGCPEKAPEKVSIELKVLFDTAKSDVKPQYNDEIKQVADFMRSYPNTSAEIEGHTDSLGNHDYNVGLSQRRADAVKQVLIDKFGVSASRLSAKGYGPDRPVASNDTAETRAKNRRVVATITAQK